MKSRGTYLALSLFFILFLSLSPSSSAGKKFMHIVEKDDTLWSICKQYYGDPYLWPELWEMNKFITNPHWLKPGDVIKLLEYEEEKPELEKKYEEEKLEPVKKIATLEEQPLKVTIMGIDVSNLTNTRTLGLLQQEKFEPCGKIFGSEGGKTKTLLGKGDTVYVKKVGKEDIKPGDVFTIYNISEPDPNSDPVTEKELGYIYSFKGILEIKEAKKDYYVAKVNESFRPIYIGEVFEDKEKDDCLMRYDPDSPCVFPEPCSDTLRAHIVASKDNLEVLGQYSVVYINAGRNKGVKRGYLFNVIEEREFVFHLKKRERVAIPATIIGKILILETTENTSTGLVFWASKEFYRGFAIECQTWDKRPKELAMFPECQIEQGK